MVGRLTLDFQRERETEKGGREREGDGEGTERWEGERERVWRQRRGIAVWLRFSRDSIYSVRFHLSAGIYGKVLLNT